MGMIRLFPSAKRFSPSGKNAERSREERDVFYLPPQKDAQKIFPLALSSLPETFLLRQRRTGKRDGYSSPPKGGDLLHLCLFSETPLKG